MAAPPSILADAAQNDFGAAIVGFDGSADFDGASRELADVADVLQIISEDKDRKRAGHLVFTKIQKVHSFRADFDSYDFSCDAFRLADMLAGFVNGDAVGGPGGTGRQ